MIIEILIRLTFSGGEHTPYDKGLRPEKRSHWGENDEFNVKIEKAKMGGVSQ